MQLNYPKTQPSDLNVETAYAPEFRSAEYNANPGVNLPPATIMDIPLPSRRFRHRLWFGAAYPNYNVAAWLGIIGLTFLSGATAAGRIQVATASANFTGGNNSLPVWGNILGNPDADSCIILDSDPYYSSSNTQVRAAHEMFGYCDRLLVTVDAAVGLYAIQAWCGVLSDNEQN